MIDLSRRGFFAMSAAAVPFRSFSADPREPQAIVPLWPAGRMPGKPLGRLSETVIDQVDTAGLRYRVAAQVQRPTLSWFAPDKPTGAAVLIIPGGGYRRVGIDREGYESARWFQSLGVAAFVLRYRLPGDGWSSGAAVAFQDAQRAMRLIRAGGGGRWTVDPARVFVLGGSAGGHLAGCLCLRVYDQSYEAVDAADQFVTRPDAGILLYPVVTMATDSASRRALIGDSPDAAAIARWSLERDVPTVTPPLMLVHAAADRTVSVDHSLALFAAVRESGGAVDLHICAEGEHGFGLRGDPSLPIAQWPLLAERWLARAGLVLLRK